MRRQPDRYDEHGQDTWTAPDEDRFAAEMGQPSVVPFPHHAPAVLAQTPVQCHECRRLAVEGVDTIVLVDGKWFHEGCVGEGS